MKAKGKETAADRAKREADRELDEALEESFPASDPMPMTGTSAGAPDDRETAVEKKPAK